MSITKAVIPVAGYGTRFLPITKTLNKTMLPILNRPVVDYVVEDCIKAGVKDIVFVILPGETQLRDYYSRNQKLEDYLLARKALDKYEAIAHVHKQANFHFVEQPQDGRYGSAIPILLAQSFIEREEAFLAFMGDDFIFNPDGSSEAEALIKTYQQSGADGAMAVTEVADNEVSKYGVVQLTKHGDHEVFKAIVEKPTPAAAPSNLINISKYIFTYDIFDHLKRVKPQNAQGEYYIIDAINAWVADKHSLAVHRVKGQYLDGGTVEGWLKANLTVAKSKGIFSEET